jgi:Na+/H+ antiporter NhaD/arsenite permease-like protein
MTAALIFLATYIGIALGRVPGLALDRVGIALLGAIAMIVSGAVSVKEAVSAIDLPTILLLYSLMIVSAQLRLGGFYTWSASRLTRLLERPRLFLLAVMVSSALLSAILANDIICFAFTPVLALALLRAGLDPLPFLIGLAVSSNIGSAATIIGNPQNMLLGQLGRLDFGHFILWCAPPATAALAGSYLLLLLGYRQRFRPSATAGGGPDRPEAWPAFNRWQTAKGLAAASVLIFLFFTPLPREISAIAVGGVLLCSRRMRTRDILGLVDWHLITLFCALFVVIEGISRTGLTGQIPGLLTASGIRLEHLSVLSAVSVVLSNLVSNVPAVMLLVRFLNPADPAQWYALAVSSTFAGNLVLIGSIANLIVVEQAAVFNIRIGFRTHAAAGVPVTLLSLAVLLLWIAL